MLAAAADGDQKAAFKLGSEEIDLNIQDWGVFIGQWDNRRWLAKDIPLPARLGRPAQTRHDDYAEMIGINPGYIKRADLAWYCSHHHNASGKNVAYGYSYLLPIDRSSQRREDDYTAAERQDPYSGFVSGL